MGRSNNRRARIFWSANSLDRPDTSDADDLTILLRLESNLHIESNSGGEMFPDPAISGIIPRGHPDFVEDVEEAVPGLILQRGHPDFVEDIKKGAGEMEETIELIGINSKTYDEAVAAMDRWNTATNMFRNVEDFIEQAVKYYIYLSYPEKDKTDG